MKRTISFMLNMPYTLAGLLAGIVSGPRSVSGNREHFAIVLEVRGFWWAQGYMKGARAMAIGHVVLLGPRLEPGDLEHELVHVEQHIRRPLIQPILYYVERWKHGYRQNKYEIEAYDRAGNIYKGQ